MTGPGGVEQLLFYAKGVRVTCGMPLMLFCCVIFNLCCFVVVVAIAVTVG